MTTDPNQPAGEETKSSGERVEDVLEGVITAASPTEPSTTDGGTDEASREGHEALDDDATFTA